MVRLTGKRPSDNEATHDATTPLIDAKTDTNARHTDRMPKSGNANTRLKVDIVLPGVRVCLETDDRLMIWAIVGVLVTGLIFHLIYR